MAYSCLSTLRSIGLPVFIPCIFEPFPFDLPPLSLASSSSQDDSASDSEKESDDALPSTIVTLPLRVVRVALGFSGEIPSPIFDNARIKVFASMSSTLCIEHII